MQGFPVNTACCVDPVLNIASYCFGSCRSVEQIRFRDAPPLGTNELGYRLEWTECLEHRGHMSARSAQPTEKDAHQKFRIETIGVRAPEFGDAGRMNDVGFNIALPQPMR